MRALLKLLPVLLVVACAKHPAKDEATKPVAGTPAAKPEKTPDVGTKPPEGLPQAPNGKPGVAGPMRLGRYANEMPDNNQFKATSPAYSHKSGDGSVIATPPTGKGAETPKTPAGE